MTIKLKVTGFRELERALAEELPKATARAAMLRTAKKVMEPVREGMERRAPELTGTLSEGMKTQVVKAKRQSRARFERSSGVSVNTGPTTARQEGGNPAWQEFGTEKMPAHPYARPTADAEGPGVIEAVREELTSQIDKAKARIAKRAARNRA